MKRIIVAMLFLATNVYAGGVGPQGPAGPAGPAGKDGVNGVDGRDASSADWSPWQGYLGAGVRVYDGKYASLNGVALKNVAHEGGIVAGLVMFKLGKSYEEREMDELKKQLGVTRRELAAVQAEQPKQVTIRGTK